MDTDGNGSLSWEEIEYLCANSVKKLLCCSDEDFVIDLANTFTKFVFKLMDLDPSEEIEVEKLKEVMSTKDSEEVDLLLMMCCAEKDQDERFIEDSIETEDRALLEKHQDFTKEKQKFLVKEQKKLKKILHLEKNPRISRKSIIIDEALKLNEEKMKDAIDQDKVQEKREKEILFDKLKEKANEKKIKNVQFGEEMEKIEKLDLKISRQQCKLMKI